MARLSSTGTPIAGQRDQSYWRVSSMMVMPAQPMIEPIERSNSPAIMSSATATARIPSGAAALRTAAVPSRLRNGGPATSANPTQTSTAAAAAPSSGRARSSLSSNPSSARAITSAAFSFVTKLGPVRMICPPPGMAFVSRYLVSRTTAR